MDGESSELLGLVSFASAACKLASKVDHDRQLEIPGGYLEHTDDLLSHSAHSGSSQLTCTNEVAGHEQEADFPVP